MVVKFKRKNKRVKGKRYQVNERIRSPELRVISNDGENIGVKSKEDALSLARDKELDLVIIAEKANPPVAKILDFSKFLYDERKKQSAIKVKSAKSSTKEFIFGPTIGEGDLAKRIERTREFINEGNKVKFTIRLRGRQRSHPEIGIEKLERVKKDLEDIAKTEEELKFRGNLITVTFLKK